MKRLTTRALTAIGFAIVMIIAGLWASPRLMAAIKAALVQNVDEPGRNPYQEGKSLNCQGQSNCALVFTTVPAGKRLVVTSVSGSFLSESGSAAHFAILTTEFGVRLPQQFLPPTNVGSPTNGIDTYCLNQTVMAYYDAGETPKVLIANGAPLANSPLVTLTGYYITL